MKKERRRKREEERSKWRFSRPRIPKSLFASELSLIASLKIIILGAPTTSSAQGPPQV